MGRSYWDGLLRWLNEEAIGRDRLDPSGLHLYTVTDEIDEVVHLIQRVHQQRSEQIRE